MTSNNVATTTPPPSPNQTIHSLYLSFLSFIFLIAFLSYYVQFPGLLSSSAGIEPIHKIFPYAYPKLYKHVLERGWIDSDSFCDGLVLLGVLLSSIAASGLSQHALIFITITTLYSILVTLGSRFYSFQWDILLLETGFVTSLCYVPWLPSFFTNKNPWPLRFLLFKLMFMSGVVKLQSNCPTWNNLTALEYHFATQCLPGPLAWHAHQLHPLLLRLGVATTFWIEIPATVLLIAPGSVARKVGVVLQVLLQILILVTGNYNFFNWLTIALCLPCWENDGWFVERAAGGGGGKGRFWKIAFKPPFLITCLFIYLTCTHMFQFRFTSHRQNYASLSLKFTKSNCESMINKAVPHIIFCVFLFLLLSVACSIRRNRSKRHMFSTFFTGILSFLCIGIIAIPMLSLTPDLQSKSFWGAQWFYPLWQQARFHRIANGYGLFRRMTGVKVVPHHHFSNSSSWGWADLPPSIVARPEIILEGLFENQTDWTELDFRWKPGNLYERPKQVAPHQPRLDWQMWFAALGSYQRNPWLVHLVYKLLMGCEPVMDLMALSFDETKTTTKTRRKIKKIRAKLWDYDFTRLETKWNRRIPGVGILTEDDVVERINEASSSPIQPVSWKQAMQWPKQYWIRTNQRQYLMELEPENPSLQNFLASNGYVKPEVCLVGMERCESLSSKSTQLFCRISVSVRERNLIYCLSAMVFAIAVVGKRKRRVMLEKQTEVKTKID